MPLSSTSVSIGHIEYEPTVDGPMNVHVDDKPLFNTLNGLLYMSEILVGNPFNKYSKQIKFVPQVEEVCFEVFYAIKQIKINNKRESDAAFLGARLYESFTNYWMGLLSSGRDVIGIRLWENVLSITHRWEENKKPTDIHKGTPYFFLAGNYLLVGERDLGFQYLYSALLNDIMLGRYAPSLNYPICAPIYLTITMSANKKNQLYPLVEELRKYLAGYILVYNQEYSKTFSISDFDDRFLDNKGLRDIVSFFVFNFMYLVESKKYGFTIDPLNEMMKLRNLDLIFNFCLIVDKTLELAEKTHGGSDGDTHFFSDGVIWISGDPY